jgi:hypothetical protein
MQPERLVDLVHASLRDDTEPPVDPVDRDRANLLGLRLGVSR